MAIFQSNNSDVRDQPVVGLVAQCLQASAVELEAATRETQQEIDGLAQLVIALTRHASDMSKRLEKLARMDLQSSDMAAIREEFSSLDAAANKTIARLQFARRLHNRISNVQEKLDGLAELHKNR